MRAASLALVVACGIIACVACGPGPGPGDAGPDALPEPFAEVSATGLDLSGAEASASLTLPQGEGPVIRTVYLVVPGAGAALGCGQEVAFDASLSLRLQAADLGPPGPGTYTVAPPGTSPSGDAVVVNGIGCNPVGGVRVTGGSVTLDIADDALVEGSLEVSLEAGSASGAFRAHLCDDEPVFLCE